MYNTSELVNPLINVYKAYSCAGFIFQTTLMDGKFNKVKDKFLDCMMIKKCAKNEHVLVIEWKIWHTKGWCNVQILT